MSSDPTIYTITVGNVDGFNSATMTMTGGRYLIKDWDKIIKDLEKSNSEKENPAEDIYEMSLRDAFGEEDAKRLLAIYNYARCSAHC